MTWIVRVALALAMVALACRPAMANRESEALRARAANAIYTLDHEVALVTFRQAVAADPSDGAALRGVAPSRR